MKDSIQPVPTRGPSLAPQWSPAELWLGAALLLAFQVTLILLFILIVPHSDEDALQTEGFVLFTYLLVTVAFTFLFYWRRPLGIRTVLSQLPDLGALGVTFILVAAGCIFTAGYYHVLCGLGFLSFATAGTESSIPPLADALSSILAAPVSEELLFRSVLFTGFKAHYGPVKGAVLSSAVFVAFHLTLLGPDALPLFVLAITAALLLHKTNSIWSAIAFHAGWNLVAEMVT